MHCGVKVRAPKTYKSEHRHEHVDHIDNTNALHPDAKQSADHLIIPATGPTPRAVLGTRSTASVSHSRIKHTRSFSHTNTAQPLHTTQAARSVAANCGCTFQNSLAGSFATHIQAAVPNAPAAPSYTPHRGAHFGACPSGAVRCF